VLLYKYKNRRRDAGATKPELSSYLEGVRSEQQTSNYVHRRDNRLSRWDPNR
jgi:hypothetical protein